MSDQFLWVQSKTLAGENPATGEAHLHPEWSGWDHRRVVAVGHCEHLTTICGDCIADWMDGYHIAAVLPTDADTNPDDHGFDPGQHFGWSEEE